MMGYQNWGMMGGIGSIGFITWAVLLIDLVLVGIWLWQQIGKK